MKILIIDDEKAILKNIYMQLNSMELGVEQIDMANGTTEAREYMKHNFYDIFLCDIVMPEEDGITFARWVLDRYQEIKFIFLTAHADFGYMKAAISMQSFDYLLQPASREELQEVVLKAIMQIRIEKKNAEIVKTAHFFVNHEDDILEEETIQYLEGKKEDDVYLNRILLPLQRENTRKTMYMLVEVQVLKTKKDFETMDKMLKKSIFQNITEEIFAPLKLKSVVLQYGTKGDLLIFLGSGQVNLPEQRAISERLVLFRDIFEKLIDTNVAIYYGNEGEFHQIREMYQNIIMVKKNNVTRESRIFYVIAEQKQRISYTFERNLVPWKKMMEQKKYDDFYRGITKCIEECAGRNGLNVDFMVKLHRAVTEILISYLVASSVDSEKIFDDRLSYLEYMNTWHDVPSFLNSLHYICERLKDYFKMRTADSVKDTILYIKQNIDKDLSVSELADRVAMNPEYFTKLFKKKTGFKLKEYIDKEKMETAKILLHSTELSITMIADHVGYADYNSFTRRFKQIIGCTPMEFRNQKMR